MINILDTSWHCILGEGNIIANGPGWDNARAAQDKMHYPTWTISYNYCLTKPKMQNALSYPGPLAILPERTNYSPVMHAPPKCFSALTDLK